MRAIFQTLRRLLFYRVKAFSLLEAGIVLLILGIISASILPVFLNLREQNQKEKSDRNLVQIQEALAHFYKNNKYYPCPSYPDFVKKDFGRAPDNCQEREAHEGLVPFITLGVPANMAKDGFGRWITYAVDGGLTAPPKEVSTNPIAEAFERTGWEELEERPKSNKLDLYWLKKTGETVPAIQNEQTIAYILVGHGVGGDGAFLGTGKQRLYNPQKSSTHTKENTNGDLTYLYGGYQEDPYFDHSVVWKVK